MVFSMGVGVRETYVLDLSKSTFNIIWRHSLVPVGGSYYCKGGKNRSVFSIVDLMLKTLFTAFLL